MLKLSRAENRKVRLVDILVANLAHLAHLPHLRTSEVGVQVALVELQVEVQKYLPQALQRPLHQIFETQQGIAFSRNEKAN